MTNKLKTHYFPFSIYPVYPRVFICLFIFFNLADCQSVAAVSRLTHHIEDGLQNEVYVDGGEGGPVVNGSNSAVVLPEERPGQLVQSRSLRLLR